MLDRTLLAYYIALMCAATLAAASESERSLSFEQNVYLSDRIVVGTIVEPLGETLELNGKAIILGFTDPLTGLVFTAHKMRVDACVFDKDQSCPVGELVIWTPGGVTREVREGETIYRGRMVLGAASMPLPQYGTEVALFLKRRGNGTAFQPIGDRNARKVVNRDSGEPMIRLEFGSPSYLSDAGRRDPRNQELLASCCSDQENPSGEKQGLQQRTRLEGHNSRFAESVSLSRLALLISQIRGSAPPEVAGDHQ